jgi:hypothetical protein
VTDAPTPDEVEARIRRALSTRSGDIASGDGAPWEPGRPRPGIVPFAPSDSPRRNPSWRTLVAAVAALAVPVAGGAVLLSNDGEPTTPPATPTCAPLDTTTTVPDTDPPTTVPPWTSDAPSSTITVPADSATPITTAPPTSAAEPDADLVTPTTDSWIDPPTTTGGVNPGAGATTSTEPCDPDPDAEH